MSVGEYESSRNHVSCLPALYEQQVATEVTYCYMIPEHMPLHVSSLKSYNHEAIRIIGYLHAVALRAR